MCKQLHALQIPSGHLSSAGGRVVLDPLRCNALGALLRSLAGQVHSSRRRRLPHAGGRRRRLRGSRVQRALRRGPACVQRVLDEGIRSRRRIRRATCQRAMTSSAPHHRAVPPCIINLHIR